ncbi:MAG: endopeptidase La, partial [Desulfobulbaceae bacterium]|nr:endopeptidase La [Desulfobulbaceae bacterium]
LENTSPASPEYQVAFSHLQLICELPWGKTTEDNLDLKNARMVLNEDHYNLKEIKQRIVEHLAVMKLNPEAKAPILCFIGPPGVGKTSLGQSIARALGRAFERFSLGGMHDEAELRGHRRTYIGAMPGRIIQAIRRSGAINPLVMLDEIDKLGRDFRGDPAAALMEILDPAQNHAFRDNYLDLPFDLSKIFFITTANTIDSIPKPLLDRMETLHLSGYSDEEKMHIAHRYLLPRQLRETGLTEKQLQISDDTLLGVIRRYTREAGVRELERGIGRLARRVAIDFAEGKVESREINPEDLAEILGPERFFAEKVRKELMVGVAIGLAWTEYGGDVLYVEALALPNGEHFTITGHLGEVMKESALAANSFILSHSKMFSVQKPKKNVHLHVPAGAIPKDGPSAGVTMAVALASLYSGKVVRSDTAMTGEITLSGLVLPVGGVKEKILAARRAGIKRIILPKENGKDLVELPEHVKEEIEFIFTETIEDVLRASIKNLIK